VTLARVVPLGTFTPEPVVTDRRDRVESLVFD